MSGCDIIYFLDWGDIMNDELLSRQLGLRINGCPIELSMELNKSLLTASKIEKANFLNRFLVKPRRDERLYMARDCTLTYLGAKKPQVVPVVEQRAPKNKRFGSTCYLWFKQKKLTRFAFQVIYNEDMAAHLLKAMEEELHKSLGSPDFTDVTSRVWEKGDQGLILEYPGRMKQGFVHLMYNEVEIFTQFKAGMVPGNQPVQSPAQIKKEKGSKGKTPTGQSPWGWECRLCRRILEESDTSCWSCGGTRKDVELT